MSKKQFLLVLLFATLKVESTTYETNRIKNAENGELSPSIQSPRGIILKTLGEPSDLTDSSRHADVQIPGIPLSGKGASYPCPDGFLPYLNWDELCYILTEPQPFPPKCPYPNYISTENLYGISQFNATIWKMIMQNTTVGDDYFYYTAQDYWYGDYIVKRNLSYIAVNHCMVINGSTYDVVSCEEKHRAFCAYPNHPSTTSRYCQKHYQKIDGYEECIPDSLDIENNRCYCIRTITKNQKEKTEGTRNSFCDALAEPLTPFQSYLLTRKLATTHKKCWFGLYMDKNKKPRWTISNTTVNYHDWAENVNYSKPYGVINFGANPGWSLAEDDGSIQCAVCELQNDYSKNVSIQLKYISSSNKIELRVTNKFQLSDRFNHFYALYCFAGPVTNAFRMIVTYSVPPDFYDDPTKDFIELIDNTWGYSIYFWCEGFQHPNFTPVYSNRLLVHNIDGYEYAICMKVNTSVYLSKYYTFSADEFRYYLNSNLKSAIDYIIRVMETPNYDLENSNVDVLIHVTTQTLENEQSDYDELEKCFKELLLMDNPAILNITRFGRTDVCLPSVTRSGNRKLHWRKTFIGAVTLPIEICLQENGEPVRRKCEGSFFHGGYWSDVKGICSDRTELSKKTQELNELLNREGISAQKLSGSVKRITEENESVTVVDIYLVAEILEKLATFEEAPNAGDVVTTISNVMNFEASELKKAQKMLNSTDKILFSLDRIMTKVVICNCKNHNIIKSPRLLVQVNDIQATNITGVALQGNSTEDDFDNFTLTPIYKNQLLGEILTVNVEVVAYLPNALVRELQEYKQPKIPKKLVIILFYNDILFNENLNKSRHTNSRILSILVPNFPNIFNSPVRLIFKALLDTDFDKKCGYWKYGFDDNIERNVKGRWSEDDVPEIIDNNNNTYATCEFHHVTHFALLVMGTFTKGTISPAHTIALNIITAIGTALSLASIMGMFATAFVSKNSRQGCSNKILLNFSVAVALQMVLLYAADNITTKVAWCLVLSACLHYTVLSEFCWMLIIAILQYRKFVIVFVKPLPHLLAKACAFSWCLPLVPVGVVTSYTIRQNNYNNQQSICYPIGKFLYFGIMLPVGIIVVTNLIIFTKIMLAVCRKKIKAYGSKRDDGKLQLVLSAFLFFLLGLSWVFGLVFSFGGTTVFAYLFCITATFQGFVLFLFFLVRNKKLAVFWCPMKTPFLCGKKNQASSFTRSAEVLSTSNYL